MRGTLLTTPKRKFTTCVPFMHLDCALSCLFQSTTILFRKRGFLLREDTM